MKERILCAAIWYKEQNTPMYRPLNADVGCVVLGHRHPHCIHTFKALTGKRTVTPECGEHIQGFLTSDNRFVDRKEALNIAIEAGQFIGNCYSNGLFSEDLY